jgi:hypothetical protein
MSMPEFTTKQYALAPFSPSNDSKLLGLNQSWTGKTVLYQTDLDCQPAKSVTLEKNSSMLTFDDGQGCVARGLLLSLNLNSSYNVYYIGYNGDGIDDSGQTPKLSVAGCNASALHEFLAVSSNHSSLLAMFCWTKYYTQDVEATVTLPENAVQSVRPLSVRRELSEQKFNYTLFEQLIVTETIAQPTYKMPPQSPILGRHDISDVSPINPENRAAEMGVLALSMLTPFALGISGFSGPDLFTTSNLQSAFQDAHRMLFALAVHSTMQQPTAGAGNITGIQEASVGALFMVEPFTYLVVGFLGLVVMLTIYLLLAYKRRMLYLNHSPNSIAAILGLAHPQMGSDSIFRGIDRASDREVAGKLGKQHFKLERHENGSCLISNEPQNEIVVSREEGSYDARPWPWELRRVTGMAFVTILGGSIVVVVLLRSLIRHNDGGLQSYSQSWDCGAANS